MMTYRGPHHEGSAKATYGRSGLQRTLAFRSSDFNRPLDTVRVQEAPDITTERGVVFGLCSDGITASISPINHRLWERTGSWL